MEVAADIFAYVWDACVLQRFCRYIRRRPKSNGSGNCVSGSTANGGRVTASRRFNHPPASRGSRKISAPSGNSLLHVSR